MTKTRDVDDGKAIIATLLILGFFLVIMTLAFVEFLAFAFISWIFLFVAGAITYGYYWGEYEGKTTATKPRTSTKLSGYDTSDSTTNSFRRKKRSSRSQQYKRRSTPQIPLMDRTPNSIMEVVIFGIVISSFFYFVNIITGVIISIIISFVIWIRIDNNNNLFSQQIRHLNSQLEMSNQE